MGQFSWLYSDTGKQMIDGKEKDSFLLVPKEFQQKYGSCIVEKCYDGYGMMGGYDVYDLVAEWNRDFIPTVVNLIKEGKWGCGDFIKVEDLATYYMTGEVPEGKELRSIGIELACYDEDNARLPYPIKITEQPLVYEYASPSESDPNQGWEYDEDEYDEDDYYYEEDDEKW